MFIEMECNRCSVANTCPRRGASPLNLDGKMLKCRIVGGFGRNPVDRTVLSDASKAASDKDGPCLTIAEVPTLDDQKFLTMEVVKIFSPPNLAAREMNPVTTSSDIEVRSYKI